MKKTILCFIIGFISGGILLNQVTFQKITSSPMATLPDGGVYFGNLKDGKLNGQGEIQWGNNTLYRGMFLEGLFEGEGYLTFADGTAYASEFKQGGLNGDAFSQYRGSFSKGKYHGEGYLELSLGSSYSGAFRAGYYHGMGMFVDEVGNEYVGQFVDGAFTGEGVFKSAQGDVYRGKFNEWSFQGKGDYKDSEGNRYIGEFVDGSFTGEGEYKAMDGSIYSGQFKNWSLHGKGKYRGLEGEYYEGEFKRWKYHGTGEYTNHKGDVYIGGFKNGLYHGEGVMVYAAALDGVKTVDGSWNWGDLRTDKNRPELLSDPDFHETVLYNQSNLLEKSWDQLQDHDANKIDLYLLSIAGDGSQGVFRRESNSLQQYFNMQLNTDGKSMQLVNSRLTSEIIPLATKTSIRRSLNAIANKMDKQQDILFLYLTSHGSKEHELYLNNSQMKLNDLTAKDLASYLKAAEIKWKVVVVSSCYSGGYIDHLADENTLIITSSAADRTSFGCESNNDFTYFGRAFIEHGLPLSNSFPDAFRLATEQVTKQELAAELEPSQPKIHQPKAILNHLKKWRNSLN